MTEYIKREYAVDAVADVYYNTPDINLSCEKFEEAILKIQTADVAPVRHGRWVDAYPDIEPNPMFMYGICSECGFEQAISKYLKYCPNCGAKMDEKENDND